MRLRMKYPRDLSGQAPAPWVKETVYGDGDSFFAALEARLRSAKKSIEIEVYIFALGVLGKRVIELLKEAAKRGVSVRIIVDGIGSSGWAGQCFDDLRSAGVGVKVYNELPWERWSRKNLPGPTRRKLARLIYRINNRNHRKVYIVDGETAFVGSFNVSDDHLKSVSGEKAWRDTGAEVTGSEVAVLRRGFEYAWFSRAKRLKAWLKSKRKAPVSSDMVRLNVRRRQRENHYLDLLFRILRARKRVWIRNAYFVPDGSLVKALTIAARSGVDVRIVMPRHSDVFFLPWVSAAFHYGLLKAGVRVFEYLPSMLHAKTMLIDDWALVGSSNLNHRSLMHDLEADVVLTARESQQELEKQFLEDITVSEEMDLGNWRRRPWWERFGGWVLLAFRYYL